MTQSMNHNIYLLNHNVKPVVPINARSEDESHGKTQSRQDRAQTAGSAASEPTGRDGGPTVHLRPETPEFLPRLERGSTLNVPEPLNNLMDRGQGLQEIRWTENGDTPESSQRQ